MDIVSLNHLQILSMASTAGKSTTSSDTTEGFTLAKTEAALPSTVVHISDEGSALNVRENLKCEAIVLVEKSDDEYAAMSFEDLINERDGPGKFRADGDTNLYVMNLYGKAAQEAFNRIRAQQMENTQNAENLGEALNQFRTKLVEINPDIDPSDIDVEFKNGALSIVGNTLTSNQKTQAQNLLENSSDESKALKNAITQFNEGGLKMINMMLYDERGHFKGENSDGKAIVHREKPVSMEELMQNTHYSDVAKSGGGYTWNKFYDLVGSTKWGAKLVFEN